MALNTQKVAVNHLNPIKKVGTNPKSSTSTSTQEMLFSTTNYLLLGLSVLILVIGFYIMSGSEDIDSFEKLTVAPIVVIFGFIVGIVALFFRKKTE
ncbi:MAG: DUF3098 domain-containing protein [Bacteroidetes bacterium]|nr:DUF3098 domain-containing protein [Bacteroidota bacterium]